MGHEGTIKEQEWLEIIEALDIPKDIMDLIPKEPLIQCLKKTFRQGMLRALYYLENLGHEDIYEYLREDDADDLQTTIQNTFAHTMALVNQSIQKGIDQEAPGI